MITTLLRFLRKKKLTTLISVTFLAVIQFIFLYKLLLMYFWRDDFYLLYVLINKTQLFWPYFSTKFPFILVYEMFHLSPEPYFLMAFFLRLVSGVVLFIVLKKITKNTLLSFFSSLLFGVTPIGIEGTLYMSHSPGFSFTAIFQALFLYFFLKKKQFLSSFFIFLAVFLFPHRGGGIIFFSLFLILFLPYFSRYKFPRLRFSLTHLSVALLGLLASYLTAYRYPGSNAGGMLDNVLNGALNFKAFGFLFFYSIIPSNLVKNFNLTETGASLFGFLLLFLCSFSIFKLRKDKVEISSYLFIGICWLVGNLLLYYLLQQYLNESESRYYSPLALGSSLLIIGLLSSLPKKIFISTAVVIVVLFGSISSSYLNTHYQKHGIYAKIFWSDFKSLVPEINNNILFVLGYRPETSEVINRLADIVRVGGLPEEASIAVHYGVDYGRINLVDDLDKKYLDKELKKAEAENTDTVYLIYDGKNLKRDFSAR